MQAGLIGPQLSPSILATAAVPHVLAANHYILVQLYQLCEVSRPLAGQACGQALIVHLSVNRSAAPNNGERAAFYIF